MWFKKMKLNVVFQSWNKIRNVFRFKDQIPIYMNSNVIYKYKCNICNDVYFGETKSYLLVCQYEHLGILIPNNYHFKFKASLVTLRLKSSLNIAEESMPLYLFGNHS